MDDVNYDDDDVFQIQVVITDPDEPVGYVNPTYDQVLLSKDPGDAFRSAAFEPAIMAHEVAHLIIKKNFAPLLSLCDSPTEACGFQEGLADYLGIIYRNFRRGTINAPWTDPVFFEYALLPDSTTYDAPRDLTNSEPHADDIGTWSEHWTGADKTSQNAYDVGLVLATALMDFDYAHGNNSFPYVLEMIKKPTNWCRL